MSKKQTAQSHGTVEAEIVAAYDAVRCEGIPALDLWEVILGRLPSLTLMEDNQSTFQLIKSGKFPKSRHVKRMHGVSVSWPHDTWDKKIFNLVDCHTSVQSVDIFTKHFINGLQWSEVQLLIGVIWA